MMNIRKARILSLDLHLGRRDWYTLEECRQAFDRLHRSQPEKENKIILRGLGPGNWRQDHDRGNQIGQRPPLPSVGPSRQPG